MMQRYNHIMQRVEDVFSNNIVVMEDDHEYQVVSKCNELLVDIEKEIGIVHNFIRDKYRLKFPELESLVEDPIDFARVVNKLRNQTDPTLVGLEGLVPSAIIMVISITATTTAGKPLPENVLEKTVEACDRALVLDATKKKVVDFLESRMSYIAPNLSAIVGSVVAAKLVGIAGGLSSLANIPSCNVQLLGARKNNFVGFSTQFHGGYIEETEIFQTTPPPLRKNVCGLLADKSSLAARVDLTRKDPMGKIGMIYREKICKKIEKWQEPPPAKQPKPLPVPHDLMSNKKKRGGRRYRKMKERYLITDMQKLKNRMVFGMLEESSLGDGLGVGYGMLGQVGGSGKLRVAVRQSKLAAKVANNKLKEQSYAYGSNGATSGLASSLAFTPMQGIELPNPQARAQFCSKYFSK
ncbi:RNA splicing factor [Lithospermum erythrorhizon]|uniref:RNA splicing factor n=1 Tax=Lithospermum erythrorhizon TaxID=34254 RepID=A0AAV3S110_LITER